MAMGDIYQSGTLNRLRNTTEPLKLPNNRSGQLLKQDSRRNLVNYRKIGCTGVEPRGYVGPGALDRGQVGWWS